LLKIKNLQYAKRKPENTIFFRILGLSAYYFYQQFKTPQNVKKGIKTLSLAKPS